VRKGAKAVEELWNGGAMVVALKVAGLLLFNGLIFVGCC